MGGFIFRKMLKEIINVLIGRKNRAFDEENVKFCFSVTILNERQECER